jgi:hypothetical protein
MQYDKNIQNNFENIVNQKAYKIKKLIYFGK